MYIIFAWWLRCRYIYIICLGKNSVKTTKHSYTLEPYRHIIHRALENLCTTTDTEIYYTFISFNKIIIIYLPASGLMSGTGLRAGGFCICYDRYWTDTVRRPIFISKMGRFTWVDDGCINIGTVCGLRALSIFYTWNGKCNSVKFRFLRFFRFYMLRIYCAWIWSF